MGKILAFVRVIPEQFWFVPALFVTAAIVLSQVLVGLDHIDYEAPAFLHNLLFATGADGARSLLSAVAAFLGGGGHGLLYHHFGNQYCVDDVWPAFGAQFYAQPQ